MKEIRKNIEQDTWHHPDCIKEELEQIDSCLDHFDKYETKSMKGKNQANKIPVYKVDLNGNILEEYSSIAECAEKENINNTTLKSYLSLDMYDSRGKRRICKGRYFIKKI